MYLFVSLPLFPVSVCTALHFGALVMRRRDGLRLLALRIALALLPPLMLVHFHGSAPCVEGFLTLTPVQLVEVTVVLKTISSVFLFP